MNDAQIEIKPVYFLHWLRGFLAGGGWASLSKKDVDIVRVEIIKVAAYLEKHKNENGSIAAIAFYKIQGIFEVMSIVPVPQVSVLVTNALSASSCVEDYSSGILYRDRQPTIPHDVTSSVFKSNLRQPTGVVDSEKFDGFVERSVTPDSEDGL